MIPGEIIVNAEAGPLEANTGLETKSLAVRRLDRLCHSFSFFSRHTLPRDS